MTKNENKKVFIPSETHQRLKEKASNENSSVDEYVEKLLNQQLGREET